jgi:hypothetical protein
MSDGFIMRWPELGKQVRVRPIGHNQEVFDWFVENLPIRALQGHTVVAGYALFALNVAFKKAFPWREKDLAKDNVSTMPTGRFTFFMTVGKVGNISVKWGEMTEPLSYVSWAEVVEEDQAILAEVGKTVWDIFMGLKKPIVHVEFVKVEG